MMSSVSPLPATPRDRAQTPTHPRRLDRLAHHRDQAGRLERVVGAEAAGLVEHPLDRSGPPIHVSVAPWPRASSSRSSDMSTQMIRSAPCSRQPATAPSPTIPAPNTTQVEPASHARGVDRRAEAGRETAGEQRAGRPGLRRDLRERDLGHHRVLGERARAHEVADRLAIAGQARGAVRQVALVLLLADRQAEVRVGAAAVDALTALGREQGHDAVARGEARDVRRRCARRSLRPRGRAPSARSRMGRRRRRCTCPCGRRHTPASRTSTSPARGSARSISVTFSGLANSSSTAARIFTVGGSSLGLDGSNDNGRPRADQKHDGFPFRAGWPASGCMGTRRRLRRGDHGISRERGSVTSTRSENDLEQREPRQSGPRPPQSASEIDLDTLLVADREHWLHGPPHDVFARLRGECPVHWTAGITEYPNEAGYWSVTRADDIHTVSRDCGPTRPRSAGSPRSPMGSRSS